MSNETFQPHEIELFRYVQKLAYQAVEYVQSQLYEGITEKEAANLIDQFLKEKGVKDFFHYGFAWFGERTAFQNFHRPILFPNELLENFSLPHFGFEFMPSNKKLEKGMPVILDVAPIVNKCAADIGYSFAFGENSLVDKVILDLEVFRNEILKMVLAENSMAEIYQKVNSIIHEMGYENCHTLYPQGVLGHKVGKIPMLWLPNTWILGFQIQAFLYLGKQVLEQRFDNLKNFSPLWNEKAKTPPNHGLWAIEPHIGKNGIGAKWEEILVITDSTAYWLDDDLPHVRFWKSKTTKAVVTTTGKQ